ncbi:hypothetical protein ACFY04_04665 [Streptomyces sp. NPDC001549]|uniref:hypothetical protein n=1 Tax=Streptomyces sp. NPDC001549 TaxID=3364586 RepID=UPI0036B32C86
MITAIARTARRQLNLATCHQLKQAGIPAATISGRSRRGGPWQRLLPRVYLLQTGPPDTRQRALSAVLYAAHPAADPLSGSTAALTGGAALALLGIRDAPPEPLDVLVRAPRSPAAAGRVRPCSTSRWPATIHISGVPSARPIRAAADFAARTDDADLVRSVLANVVQGGWCHPHDLHAELRAGLAAAGLPAPLWNARLHGRDGAFLASPDAYWPEEGVALEIDSAEYHYTRDAWQATLYRRLRLESRGVLVASTTPGLLHDRPADVIAALRALLVLGAARPAPPEVTTRGHAQLELPLPPA